MHPVGKLTFILVGTLLIGSCGLSDYINTRKISKAPVYKAPPETSECDFHSRRIERVSNFINRVRASNQTCGDTTYPATAALHWNHKLSLAAKHHSDDMAKNNFFAHKGSRGLVLGDRVNNAAYQWKNIAENIAGGADTPEQTIEQWLASPGHCRNMMNPAYTEFALACTRNNISDYRIYWTLVLAAPNSTP